MRPVSTDSDGPAPPENFSCPYPLVGPLPPSEMSLLQSLGPVQSWLGQELEKCGIDAMIYTRYVLSLLLHDSYDYDLQDQENDIFLGWEKGAGKKWGRSKKKGGTDLSLEEMKKQAAVQCLRSASDENSGIESLVEELCTKLKDIQNKQKEEKRIQKKSDGSQSPERVESPSSKDQVEMYYEAFPPLSEKPVCLQEIMTVWNKAKASSYSSSSSAAPQTSTDTSSPKDNSEGETTKERNSEACGIITTVTNERGQQRRSKKEKENRYQGGASAEDKSTVHLKRQNRHRSEGKYRPRSWSSGSSEAGSSSSGNQGDSRSSKNKNVRMRHKSREAGKNKRTRNSGQVKLQGKVIDKEERRNPGGSSTAAIGGAASKQSQLYKKGKRPLKEIRKDPGCLEPKESGVEARNKKEYMEEPLWYTEPITEYLIPFSSHQSKLETKYRSKEDFADGYDLTSEMDRFPDNIQGVCIASESYQRAYIAAGSFVDGHFVEGLVEAEDESAGLIGTLSCPQPEERRDLDDKHLSEFTDFYEVDIYQSMLDTSASDSIQESRILSMIRQKSREQGEVEAGCCLVLDGLEQQGKSAIRADSQEASGSVGFLMEDLENMVQVWGCYSPSTSEDVDGESFIGDSPVRLSPLLDSVSFTLSKLSGNVEEPPAPEATSEPSGLNSSCFNLFELQYDSPTFPLPHESLSVGHENNTDSSSCLEPHSNKQSRLLIWTKNSAFDETEHCSNLSTRTCSPWSHSEETRSDNEQGNATAEDAAQIGNDENDCAIPPLPAPYRDDQILDFLQEDSVKKCEEVSVSTASNQTFTKISKLESVCGIALESNDSKQYSTGGFLDNRNQQSDDYSSGIIKDIWTAIGNEKAAMSGPGAEKSTKGLFSQEPSPYCCSCLEDQTKGLPVQRPQKKAVQRSEYHLWEGKKQEQDLAKNSLSKVGGAGDYMTPSKPWALNSDKETTSFILGGVYGELKTLSSDKNWAVVPPSGTHGSLLQCAAATASSSDLLTITGKDVFMNKGSCFAPGHRPLWRPLVSFGQSDQAIRGSGDGMNKGFSLIFHEDLLGSYRGLHSEDQGLEYPFASFNLNNPFSQVLHVECSFEPEDMASFSPGFKPKSILCSDSESEPFHSQIYGINRTQYRAIRISPRTHFRPISASELSPVGVSDSEAETDKEEAGFPALAPVDVFDDPQADLKPLEEDAECEGPYYGKSELESGKFLPRLKKSGMEKSAQTSLDSQEGSSSLLPIAEQETCLDCKTAAAASNAGGQTDVSVGKVQREESAAEKQSCLSSPKGPIPKYGMAYDFVGDVPEFSLLNIREQGGTESQQNDCWWQNTICPPPFPWIPVYREQQHLNTPVLQRTPVSESNSSTLVTGHLPGKI
uniref:KIAA0232 n=1 Tax=Oryzias sinensis TaxID=183150 RepID=A0A8C7XW61_9TELE